MNKVIYIIGVLAVLTGFAIIPDVPISAKIGVDGALLILADIFYEYFYGE